METIRQREQALEKAAERQTVRDATPAAEPAQTLKPQWDAARQAADRSRPAGQQPPPPERTRAPANDNAAQREQPQPHAPAAVTTAAMSGEALKVGRGGEAGRRGT